MTIMHQRVAHNFAKSGYYPTDSETTARILSLLEPCEEGTMRVCDPCAGEGVALFQCQDHLGLERTESYGIELDKQRAKTLDDYVTHGIHADFLDCITTPQAFGLLWLNPPYGGLSSDEHHQAHAGRQRLEKLFYQHSHPLLQMGGVLVFIIPQQALDDTLVKWIARHFDKVQCFRAVESQFKQLVIIGERKHAQVDTTAEKRLRSIMQGDLPPVIPECSQGIYYIVPPAKKTKVSLKVAKIDADKLQNMIQPSSTLWSQFVTHFGQQIHRQRRPLVNLSKWHLGLAVAGGNVSGLVSANDKRCFLIKGDTHKEQDVRLEYDRDENDNVTEKRIMTDKFVAVIRAIDMTTTSETYGQVFIIK